MKTAQLVEQAFRLHKAGDISGAEKILLQLLEQDPADFSGRHFLGLLRAQQGRYPEAIRLIEGALLSKPDDIKALSDQGDVLLAVREYEKALASYDHALAAMRAVRKGSHSIRILFNRGLSLQGLRRFDQALHAYAGVLSLQSSFIPAIVNRAILLFELNQLDQALAEYERALALEPKAAEAWNGRATVLWELRRFDEALKCFKHAIAIKPDFIEAHYGSGNVHLVLGQLNEAVDSYGKAIALAPKHPYAYGGYATAALHLCDWTRTEKIFKELEASEGHWVIPPMTLLGYSGDSALLRHCAERNIRERVPKSPPPLWRGEVYQHDRIRVAYLSSNFGRHPVAYQMAEVFECHDRTCFQVIGISTGPDDGSDFRSRLTQAFDEFYDGHKQSDHSVANTIRSREVDILVELGGHTRGSRLEILSHRPAPVQTSYLGYAGTSGSNFIDYLIADEIVAPTSDQRHFSEHLVHLPKCFFPHRSQKPIELSPSRRQLGLPEHGFVFCCFNNGWKITELIFDIWARLLRSVPGSILWLRECGRDTNANLRRAAEIRGIDATRLIFAPRFENEADHLARYRVADLFLDTLPYNAHATAYDALSAGLPLVTCRGTSYAGRVSSSLLCSLGVSELSTESLKEYEALALKLSQNTHLLKLVRGRILNPKDADHIFNPGLFRRHLEAAYQTMWERNRRRLTPQAFAVPEY